MKPYHAIINLRVDGVSRHSNVDDRGVTRSMNASCTCVRSFKIKKIENRVMSVWIKEASQSPDDLIGSLMSQYEAHVYLPPDAFTHAWEAALALTVKQLNLTALLGEKGELFDPQALPLVAFSLDELLPRGPEPAAALSRSSNVISYVFWTMMVLYGCWGAAKYFNVI